MGIVRSKDNSSAAEATDVSRVNSNAQNGVQNSGIDDAYLRASRPTKFFKGVLFQMILFGA
jgi:hypothetical protein